MMADAKKGTKRDTREDRIKKKKALQKELAELRRVDMRGRDKAGLALSGGGYRASLFHLGALWRLNELGWLRKLNYITSVSGGSIVAAFLGTRWLQLKFEKKDGKEVATNFDDAFVKPMRKMFATTIDIPTILTGLFNPIGSARGRVDGQRLADGAIDLLGQAAKIFGGSMGKSFATSFARPFGAFFGTGVDAAAAAWELNPFPTPSERLIAAYDRELFHGKTLQDLPEPKKDENPLFCLYATNMQTGVSVRMTREYLSDYRLGEVEKPDISLARAVAASSGFPPFYCPVEVKLPAGSWKKQRRNAGGEVEKKGETELFDRTRLREQMDLGDGAVYDNLGLTMLEFNCETILVSDAGDTLDVIDALPFEWLSQVVRTLLVAMNQENNLRKGSLIEEFREGPRRGTYWGISSKIKRRLEKAEPPRPSRKRELLDDNEKTRALGETRTRLNRFTDQEQENLINWGYALADARMRRHVIGPEEKDVPGRLPYSNRLK